MQVQVVVTLPAIPVRVAAARMKWATDRIGPVAWVIVAVLIGGGIYWHLGQPPERREKIRDVAVQVGTHWLNGGRAYLRGWVVELALSSWPGTRCAGQSGLVGEHHELRAVSCAELGHGVVDVGLDGERAERELAGDLGV